jgi:hypothetical protein
MSPTQVNIWTEIRPSQYSQFASVTMPDILQKTFDELNRFMASFHSDMIH